MGWAWRRFAVLGVVLLSSFSLAGNFPSRPGEDTWENRPSDPDYAGHWELFSHLPPGYRGRLDPAEQGFGSGARVDLAWQRHVGTPDTVIAVLDSGIYWDASDLKERFALNRGELPLPLGASTHDANGDGRFSVSDYASDPRVSDANGNGARDPGDLIQAFSDGRDEDGNGYADDICGWDFHEGDNDAFDRGGFGHGTAEAKDSAAALNNGVGGAGPCGNCSVLPLRVADSFIVDANAFAEAVRFATASGVAVIQQALGSVNHSPYVKRALDWAYERGIPVVGSAADENSYHHNYPSTLDPVIYANSMRHDTRDPRDATTFLNFNNCSNFGARVDVAVPSLHCSSEATGVLSGIVALAVSYARSLDRGLGTGEFLSLVKNAATDVARDTSDPFRHPTFPGWDTMTGYGRADADAMLRLIETGSTPPEARILAPEWFEVLRADRDECLVVTARARLPRSGRLRARLEGWAGAETSGAEPRVLFDTGYLSRPLEGTLAEIPTRLLGSLPRGPRDPDRYRFAVTLRLVVEDGNGLAADSRRTIFLLPGDGLHAGFPVKLEGSGESAGFFLDLNGDGKEELVTGDGAGFVHALTSTGAELSGFPAFTAPSLYRLGGTERPGASIVAPLAGGDIAGDFRPEIVAVSYEGTVSVLGADGRMLPGFPLRIPDPERSRMGREELLARGALASPVLADVDGDGTPDFLLGSNHVKEEAGLLFAVSGKGNRGPAIPGFPLRVPIAREVVLPTVGTGLPTAPALGDPDGDGRIDVLIHPFLGASYLFPVGGGLARTLGLRVSPRHDTNDTHMLSAFGHPAFADLDGDGRPEPVGVGVGRRALTAIALNGKRFDAHHMLGAWDGITGVMRDGFPRRIDDTAISPSPVSADLDGDGRDEIVVGSGGYFVHAFAGNGEVPGFPRPTGGWSFGAASIGDIDGDGEWDVGVTTREGFAFVWRAGRGGGAKSPRARSAWRTFKANPRRTGHWNGGKHGDTR